jgi:hypothetical protein
VWEFLLAQKLSSLDCLAIASLASPPTSFHIKKYSDKRGVPFYAGLMGFEPTIFRVTGGRVNRYTTSPIKLLPTIPKSALFLNPKILVNQSLDDKISY